METESEAVVAMPVETLKQANSEKELATTTDNQELETSKEPKAVGIAVTDNPGNDLLVSEGLESAATAADDPSSEKEVKNVEAPQAVRPATPTESSLDPVASDEVKTVEAAPEPAAALASAPEKKQHSKKHHNVSILANCCTMIHSY